MADTKRRARGEDSIYYDRSRDRWTGTITVGWKPDGRRDRITVRGRTKTEVKDKLRARHLELAAGVRPPAHYSAGQCLKDWLETLNAQAESTVTGYRIMVRHLTGPIGNVKLADLKVRDVDFALGKLAERLLTRSVRLARMILIQAIRNAMVNDLVVRNVADLTAVPTGKPGRPSRSLNLDQALAVLDAAKGERPWPYVAVSTRWAAARSAPPSRIGDHVPEGVKIGAFQRMIMVTLAGRGAARAGQRLGFPWAPQVTRRNESDT